MGRGMGESLDNLRVLRTDGVAVGKAVGEPFANRASTRPTLPHSVGSLCVIASTVPDTRTKMLMRTNAHIGKCLRFWSVPGKHRGGWPTFVKKGAIV